MTVHTPEGPKRRPFYGRTRKEASDKMLAAMGRPHEAAPKEALTITVGEWLDAWLSASEATVGPQTHARYSQVVRNDLKPAIGDVRLRRLAPVHVEDLRDEMLRRAMPATVKYSLGVLSTALNRAVARDLVERNPASSVRRPKDRAVKMRPISAPQAARLVASARGTREEAFYALAVKLGPRQGELAALFWSDLDAEAGTLAIRRSAFTHGAGTAWGETKTGEARTIKLPTSVRESLERHRAIQAEERLGARSWEDPRLVFPNRRGGVHRRNSVMVIFRRHLEAAELPRIRFHDLRHTAAVNMLNAGVPVNVVSQILGHKDPAMTLRRYAHVLSDAQQMAADKIDGYGW